MVSCQKCRQPISPTSFPNYDPIHASRPPHLEDSLSSLSPSTYDFLSHSERYQHPHQRNAVVPASIRPYYNAAIEQHRSTSSSPSPRSTAATQRIVVPSSVPSQPTPPRLPPHLGPAESFVVLTDSVYRPPSSSSLPPSFRPSSQPNPPSHAPTHSDPSSSSQPSSLNSRLTQLCHLSSLLSSTSSIDHPLCTECADTLVLLMQIELEEGKKERDRLVLFEREMGKKREEMKRDGNELTREGLEKDIMKLKKAESHAITELKAVESTKESLEAELKALEAEEAELAAEEAEFWTEHSKYVIERDVLQTRQNSLLTRLSNSQKELDKLQRTNVYNDTFCIGQESTLGTINSLRLGRLPTISPPVEWSEINAALGHTLLLLQTISRKFGMREFKGWRLKCMGSFSRIVRVEGEGKEGESYELYGSSDLSISRVLQNRRFDFAMVAFLDCLRQLIEWVCERDRSVRIPHRIVKDKIGDVSIKYQFGSDETWSRALRHVLLDLKILLGRASI
ncbi:beclin 1 [Sporobolomyces salmoneus]|uniref:beclin 1 n=1 Tax=Sporobolomyces salmoneus TaxID=183962 RepID=UPI003182B3BE